MEIRKMDVDSIPVRDLLALLEIARGLSPVPADWLQLKQKLAQYDTWFFYDGSVLLGYALVNSASPYFGGSVQFMELKYRWEYNQEAIIAGMISAIARSYQGTSDWMVIQVDTLRDLNCSLYQKMGFSGSAMQSPLGQGYALLYSKLDSLLESGFHA